MEIKKNRSFRKLLIFIYLSLVVHFYLLLVVQNNMSPDLLKRLFSAPKQPETSVENIIVESHTRSKKTPDKAVISDKANLSAGKKGSAYYNHFNPNPNPPRNSSDVRNPSSENPTENGSFLQPKKKRASTYADASVSLYDPEKKADVSMDNSGHISLATIPKDYSKYFLKMSRKIGAGWRQFFPVFQYYQGIIRSGSVVVRFQIDRSGNVVAAKVIKSFGYSGVNRSCLNAVLYSGNFGPLPESLKTGKPVIVDFTFTYVAQ